MKIFKIFLLCVLITTGAYSATKCVSFSGTTSCTNGTYKDYYLEWGMTCNKDKILGIMMCSTTYTSVGAAVDAMQNKGAVPERNKHCWCKTLKPVPSKWVYVKEYTTGDECTKDCSYSCQYYGRNNSTVKSSLLTSRPAGY